MKNSEETARVVGKPFPPGVSGNPNVRPPKGYSITEAFKSMLAADPEVKRDIVESIKLKALKGDTAAQKLIWQYMDGMPAQAIEHTGPDGSALEVRIKMV